MNPVQTADGAKPPTLAHIRKALKISEDAFGSTRDLMNIPKERLEKEMADRGFSIRFEKNKVRISKQTIGGRLNTVVIKRDEKTGKPIESIVAKQTPGASAKSKKQGERVLKNRLLSRARTTKEEKEMRLEKAKKDLEKAKDKLAKLQSKSKPKTESKKPKSRQMKITKFVNKK